MYGCELRKDGSKGGFEQYGYEGKTFITFDKETRTWVAPVPQAQISKRKRDADQGLNQRRKDYLEEICIEWLEKYLSYGNETLLRTGEHLDPGWTFLLYGRISLTHSAPLGPLSGACLPWWESSSSPSSPSCRTREAPFGSHCQAAIQWTRKCSLSLAGKALQGVLFTAHHEATIWGYSGKPPLAKR
ncbi:popy class I histocompatibility antigen, alpha chain E-like [Notechis scutatus]|uniref:Popy class I histocompatibility antigen, alpha chain E-like n=1 Tax=Notechis scutatus TaxID=8663 RepID=A0A6J1W4N8_9SAUR|nr:popy class I histocompatibility antigen, alpha chain E-like [Notechis scutatus]